MKKCSRCGESKPLDQFAWRSKAAQKRIAHCKSCQSTYFKDFYSRNAETERERARRTNRVNRRQLRALTHKLKEVACKDCEGRFKPWQMDFDHLPGHIKIETISRLVASGSRKSIEDELKKCDVVCANCHRDRTHQRANAGVAR